MFSLRTYVYFWVVVSVFIGYEFFALSQAPSLSFVLEARDHFPFMKGFDLNLKAGKTLSLYFGWIGFGLMCLTNLYVLRKHVGFLASAGRVSGWLDFHIFCGLLGPTLILFHTGFKVGGLVAISFWSMVVSFSSGVVGRYFYLQLVHHKSDVERNMKAYEASLQHLGQPVLQKALVLAGVHAHENQAPSLLRCIFGSIVGDFRLSSGMKELTQGAPLQTKISLREFAVSRRRIVYMEQFRKIMGYWHSFHMPFAIFMYLVAFIHIATALLFKV